MGYAQNTQILYLVDEHAKLRVDYIGCYERYEEIYDFTRKKFHEDYGYVKHVAMQNGTPWTQEN